MTGAAVIYQILLSEFHQLPCRLFGRLIGGKEWWDVLANRLAWLVQQSNSQNIKARREEPCGL